MDLRVQELLDRLQALYRDASKIEAQLSRFGIADTRLLDPEKVAWLVRELERRVAQFEAALARVNFHDDHYRFIRAIDGDTIVVAPPDVLREWISDIHVRLYGLETPELREPLGEVYRRHLEELCAIDGQGRLMIVWEREREGTNYQGFPMSSFERGIGHVFFRGEGDHFVYINALMQALEHCSVERAGRSLLRGRRAIDQLEVRLAWTGSCPSWRHSTERMSSTLQRIMSAGPPACLVTYSRLPAGFESTAQGEADTSEAVAEAMRSFGCPLESEYARCHVAIRVGIQAREVSAFDLPLTLMDLWASKVGRRLTGA